MAVEIDKKYVEETYKRYKRLGGINLFFNDFVVMGYDNLAKPGQRLEISNHLSHADYMIRWWASQSNGLQIPIIPAGINLKSPIMDAMGLNFSKLGGFWVDRNSLKSGNGGSFAHARELYNIFPEIIESGNTTLIFAEGGRNEGEVMSKFEPAGIRSVLKHGKDIGLACLSFDYDNRIENWLIDSIRARRDKRDWLYKSMDLSTFLLRPIIKQFVDVGNAYMNVGPVVRLNDVARGSDLHEKLGALRDYSTNEVRRLYQEIQEEKTKRARI